MKIVSPRSPTILNEKKQLSRRLTNLFDNMNTKTDEMEHASEISTLDPVPQMKPHWFVNESSGNGVGEILNTTFVGANNSAKVFEAFKSALENYSRSKNIDAVRSREKADSIGSASSLIKYSPGNSSIAIETYTKRDHFVFSDDYKQKSTGRVTGKSAVDMLSGSFIDTFDNKYDGVDSTKREEKLKSNKHKVRPRKNLRKAHPIHGNVLTRLDDGTIDLTPVQTNVKNHRNQTHRTRKQSGRRVPCSNQNSEHSGKELTNYNLVPEIQRNKFRTVEKSQTESHVDESLSEMFDDDDDELNEAKTPRDNTYIKSSHHDSSCERHKNNGKHNKCRSSVETPGERFLVKEVRKRNREQSKIKPSSKNSNEYVKFRRIIGEHQNIADKLQGTPRKEVNGEKVCENSHGNLLQNSRLKNWKNHQLESVKKSSLDEFPAEVMENSKHVFVILPCDKVLKQDFQMFKIPVPDESILGRSNHKHVNFSITPMNNQTGGNVNSLVSESKTSIQSENDRLLNELLTHLSKGMQVSDRHTKLSWIPTVNNTPKSVLEQKLCNPSKKLEYQLMADILKELTEVVDKLDSISKVREVKHSTTVRSIQESNCKCKYCEIDNNTRYENEKKTKKHDGGSRNKQRSEEKEKKTDSINQKENPHDSNVPMLDDQCKACGELDYQCKECGEKIDRSSYENKMSHEDWRADTHSKTRHEVSTRPAMRSIKQSSHDKTGECTEIMKMLERVLESENSKKKYQRRNSTTTNIESRFEKAGSGQKDTFYDDCYDALVLLESYLNARRVELKRSRAKSPDERHYVNKSKEIKQNVVTRTPDSHKRAKPTIHKVNDMKSLEPKARRVPKTKKELRRDNSKYLNNILNKKIPGADFIGRVIFRSNPGGSITEQDSRKQPGQGTADTHVKAYREQMNRNCIGTLPCSCVEIEKHKRIRSGENPLHARPKLSFKNSLETSGMKFACRYQHSKAKDRQPDNDICHEKQYNDENEVNTIILDKIHNSNKPRTISHSKTKKLKDIERYLEKIKRLKIKNECEHPEKPTNLRKSKYHRIKPFREKGILRSDLYDTVEDYDPGVDLIGKETDRSEKRRSDVPLRIGQPVQLGSKLYCYSKKVLPTSVKDTTYIPHLNCRGNKIKCDQHYLPKPNMMKTVYQEEFSTTMPQRDLWEKTQESYWLQQPVNQYVNETRSFLDKMAPSFHGNVEKKSPVKWISSVPVRNRSKGRTEHELMKYNGLYYYPSDYYVYEDMDDVEDQSQVTKKQNGHKNVTVPNAGKIMLNFTKILHIYSPQNDIQANKPEAEDKRNVHHDCISSKDIDSTKSIDNERLDIRFVHLNKFKIYSNLSRPNETKTTPRYKEISDIPVGSFKENTGCDNSCTQCHKDKPMINLETTRSHESSTQSQYTLKPLQVVKKPTDMSDFLADDFLRKPDGPAPSDVSSWMKQNFDFCPQEPLAIRKCDGIRNDISEFNNDDAFLQTPLWKKQYLTDYREMKQKSLNDAESVTDQDEKVKQGLNGVTQEQKVLSEEDIVDKETTPVETVDEIMNAAQELNNALTEKIEAVYRESTQKIPEDQATTDSNTSKNENALKKKSSKKSRKRGKSSHFISKQDENKTKAQKGLQHKANREKSDFKINIFNITFNKLAEGKHNSLQIEPKHSEGRHVIDSKSPVPKCPDKDLKCLKKRINSKVNKLYRDTSRQKSGRKRLWNYMKTKEEDQINFPVRLQITRISEKHDPVDLQNTLNAETSDKLKNIETCDSSRLQNYTIELDELDQPGQSKSNEFNKTLLGNTSLDTTGLSSRQPHSLLQSQFAMISSSPQQTLFTNGVPTNFPSQPSNTSISQQSQSINKLSTTEPHTVDPERLKRLLDTIRDEFYKYNFADRNTTDSTSDADQLYRNQDTLFTANKDLVNPLHRGELWDMNNEREDKLGGIFSLLRKRKLSRDVLNKLLREIHKTIRTATINNDIT